jgi:hypothetical protein
VAEDTVDLILSLRVIRANSQVGWAIFSAHQIIDFPKKVGKKLPTLHDSSFHRFNNLQSLKQWKNICKHLIFYQKFYSFKNWGTEI